MAHSSAAPSTHPPASSSPFLPRRSSTMHRHQRAASSFPLDSPLCSSPVAQCSVGRQSQIDSSRLLRDDLPPAGGVTHLDGTPIKSFVVWRLLGRRHVLELRRVFLASAPPSATATIDGATAGSAMIIDPELGSLPDPKHSNAPVLIHLPAAALQTPSIALDETGRHLHVMLVTVTGMFIRLVFEGPNYFYDEGWRRRKIYRYQIRALLSNRSGGPPTKPVIVQFPNLNDMIVGCSDGAIVKVTYHKPAQESEDEDEDSQDEEAASASGMYEMGLLYTNELGTDSRVVGYKELKLAEGTVINHLMQVFTPKKWFSPFKGPAKTPAAEPADDARQPIAMNSVQHFGFALCRDRQLRVWNLKKESKWGTVNVANDYAEKSGELASAPGPLTEAHTGHFIQIFDEREFEDGDEFDVSDLVFKAAVHVPPAQGGSSGFAIYKGKIDRFGDLQEFLIDSFEDAAGIDDTLVDFMVIPSLESAAEDDSNDFVLWTLWRQEDGTISVRHAPVRNFDTSATRVGKTQWRELVQPDGREALPSVGEAEDPDVAKAYISYVDHPGRFAAEVKRSALESYREGNGGMFLDSLQSTDPRSRASLVDEIKFAVQSAVSSESSSVDVEWRKFISHCQKLHNQTAAPAAIDWDSSYDAIVVTSRSFVTVIRDCEPAEILRNWHTNSSHALPLAAAHDAEELACFTDPDAKAQLMSFLSLSDWITTRLPSENLALMENRINSIAFDPPADFVKSSKQIAETVFPISASNPSGDGEFAEFTTRFSQIPPSFFDTLVAVLTSDGHTPTLPGRPGETPNTSGFTNYLVAMAFSEAVAARYRLVRDVTSVLLFAAHVASPQQKISCDKRLASLAPALRSLLVAKWIATQNVKLKRAVTAVAQPEISPVRAAGGLTGRLKELNLTMTEQQTAAPATEEAIEPLAFHLLQQQYLLKVDFGQGEYGLQLTKAVGTLISDLGIFKRAGSEDPLTSSPLLKLVVKLFAFQHLDVAKELVDMLPKSPAVFYLRARIAADLGELDAAERDFDRAAVDIGKSSTLAEVLDHKVLTGGPTAYDQDLMQLFARKGCSHLAVKYSAQALAAVKQQTDSAEKTRLLAKLYNENFRHNLKLHEYEAAYASVVGNPDPQIRLNCLRLLVGSMCEAGDLDGLCGRFAFGVLQEEVELELCNKIRTTRISDCVGREGDESAAPNYYRIYHAYSVSRDDYRTAAATMYLYASKIDAELLLAPTARGSGKHRSTARPIVALQELCAAYLASLNALLSVDTEYAYILIPVTAQPGPSKRRRLDRASTDGDSPAHKQVQKQRVVRPHDIRGEYLLALAKLNLCAMGGGAVHGAVHQIMTPPDALALLTSATRFDDALAVGTHFKLDVSRTFEAIAEKCVWLAKRETPAAAAPALAASGGCEDLTDDPDLAWTGSDARRAWRLLCGHLDVLDASAGVYRAAVVDRVLFVDPLHPLPMALTAYYQVRLIGVQAPPPRPAFRIDIQISCSFLRPTTRRTCFACIPNTTGWTTLRASLSISLPR